MECNFNLKSLENKLVDIRFERGQILAFWEGTGRQDIPKVKSSGK